MEQTGEFTVNLLPPDMAEDVAFCGEQSGRDYDKFAERDLTTSPASKVKAPLIDQALLQFECRTVQKTDVVPAAFDPAIIERFYSSGDFHRVYFGEIMAVHAEEGFLPSR